MKTVFLERFQFLPVTEFYEGADTFDVQGKLRGQVRKISVNDDLNDFFEYVKNGDFTSEPFTSKSFHLGWFIC